MARLRRLCRNRQVRRMICIACLLLAMPQGVAGRDYRTSLLRQAAATLRIEHRIAQVGKGVTTMVESPAGLKVSVRTDANGTVEHIGLPLFSEAMRRQMPSPVYDCLEYAALDRSAIHSDNDLLLQKIRFYKGSWQSLPGIEPTDRCTITNHGDKYYQLALSRNGRETVSVAVPIDYELLSVSNRREIEKNFVRNVAHHHAASKAALPLSVDPQLAKAEMHLSMSLSNYSRKTVSVTLRQWIAYCESQGCATTIKYDDSDETVIRGYVTSRNSAMGYHHLLELAWTMEDLSQPSPKIKGKALLFIPNNEKK